MSKRAFILLHYNKNHSLSQYVLQLLKQIKPHAAKLVFVSNTPIDDHLKGSLSGLSADIIIRENKGYDFGAWKDAIHSIGLEALSTYDSLTLLNDSCFGPFHDLGSFLEDMENRDSDFFGITNHVKCWIDELDSKFTIEEHIQSYYMSFSKAVVSSKVFSDFWDSVDYLSNVHEVIKKYETQLTHILVKSGFQYTSLIDTTDPDKYKGHPNVAHTNPLYMLAKGSPFVKVKNFVENPAPPCIALKYIEDTTDYPTSLIYDHISDNYSITLPAPDTTNVFNTPPKEEKTGKFRTLKKALFNKIGLSKA